MPKRSEITHPLRRAADEVAYRIGSALHGIRNHERLLNVLLEKVCGWIHAEQGAVWIAGQQPIVRGERFEIDQDLGARAAGGNVGILVTAPDSTLCVPIRFYDEDLGILYFRAPKADAWTADQLGQVVAIAAEVAPMFDATRHLERLEAETEELATYVYGDKDMTLIGESKPMKNLLKMIHKGAPSGANILILSETGTGKELVAKTIHRISERPGSFIAVNCAVFPEDLLASELFGYEKGAFTGALAAKKGKVELAEGGTLFLDEIGELSLRMQIALLRFLQESEYERLGGTHVIKANVRVIAATNRDLREEVRKGTFREDLFHRLNVFVLRPPALREMREDIPTLAAYFFKQLQFLKPLSQGISREALDVLVQCDWPGNVRQFENAIRHAMIITESDFVQPEDLPESCLEVIADDTALTTYAESLKLSKKEVIERTLNELDWNYTAAALVLRITTRHLRRLVREFKIKPSKKISSTAKTVS
jgi:transcriptional regulator with GAF, ATPase, and Fis domain